ncbi:MAG TPA: SIR2 family protein [Anaerolineales bacterium]|nr:SIR2 family protein [Anaerolineales bacterium]
MASLTNIPFSFLLGSGASIPAKMPRTNDITEIVLSGKDVWKHSDGSYYLEKTKQSGWDVLETSRITEFVNILKKQISLFYEKRFQQRETNYEDLYYVADQITSVEDGDYDNPAIQALIDKILPECTQLMTKTDLHEAWNLLDLASEATYYIMDIAWRLLLRSPGDISYLSKILSPLGSRSIPLAGIFTLNHDTVLEHWLSQNRVQFIDGFSDPVNGVRYWNPNSLVGNSSKVKLFKLHGSVNWFSYPSNAIQPGVESVGIPFDWDFQHTLNPEGKRQYSLGPNGPRPAILMGTFNKMFNYTMGIFADIYCLFRQALRDTNSLVIIGYGFGDKGVNTQIIEWAYLSANNKIILIEPNPEKLKIRARLAIQKHWDRWLMQKKFKIISKGIENVTWEELVGEEN